MHCPSCGFATPEGMKFCGQCGAPLSLSCRNCGFVNPPGFAFCGQCGTALAEQTPTAVFPALASRSQAPRRYTPSYLAEKILTSRTALEGERKQVTVLFADLNDATELIRGLDPEAAQQLLDPPLHRMIEAVYRFEGAVNQALGVRPLQAHRHHGLGTPYALTGQPEQARAELETATELYHAMAMTFWLPQAEAALAQVEGR
jgi:class 3 adenylate cyclase